MKSAFGAATTCSLTGKGAAWSRSAASCSMSGLNGTATSKAEEEEEGGAGERRDTVPNAGGGEDAEAAVEATADAIGFTGVRFNDEASSAAAAARSGAGAGEEVESMRFEAT